MYKNQHFGNKKCMSINILEYYDLSVKSPFYRIWLQYIVVTHEANIPNTVTLVIKLPF